MNYQNFNTIYMNNENNMKRMLVRDVFSTEVGDHWWFTNSLRKFNGKKKKKVIVKYE